MNRSDHHYRWILIKRKPSSSDKYFLGLFGACSDNNELKMLVIPNDECINADRPALKTPVPSTTLCPHILEEQLKKTGENQELNYSEKEGNHLDKLSKLINDTPDVSGKSVHEIAFEDHEIAYDDLITKVVNNSWTNITSHRIVLSGKTAKNTGIRSWSGVIIKSDMIKDQGEKIW